MFVYNTNNVHLDLNIVYTNTFINVLVHVNIDINLD